MILCILHFLQEHDFIDFRCAELDSLLLQNSIDPELCYDRRAALLLKNTDAFLQVRFPNEEVIKNICSRSVMIKCVYELWSWADSLAALVEGVRTLPNTFTARYMGPELSWSVKVGAYMRSYSSQQQENCRVKFNFLKFTGPVNLSSPNVELMVVLDFSGYHAEAAVGVDEEKGGPEDGAAGDDVKPVSAKEPEWEEFPVVPCFLGRVLSRGGMREELKRYDLKRRLYLGPTSLDCALAMIMANLAGAAPGSMMLDPFVGTASILVALSHFGAKCVGYDIDIRVLKGISHANVVADRVREVGTASASAAASVSGNLGATYSVGGQETESTTADKPVVDKGLKLKNLDHRTIWDNFKSYGLEAPELVRMDNHLFDRHLAPVVEELYDAVVTDPPYGIRAGAKKSGRRGTCEYVVPEELRPDHVPATQQYPVEEVVLDLLHVAAVTLKIGGRLLYLLPTTYDFTADDAPLHPCLVLEHLCQQPLSTRHCRYLVVMRKTSAYDGAARSKFGAYKASVLGGQDERFGTLLAKLQLALSHDAHADETVVKSISKSCQKRRDRRAKRICLQQEGKMGGKMRPGNRGRARPGGEDEGGDEAAADPPTPTPSNPSPPPPTLVLHA